MIHGDSFDLGITWIIEYYRGFWCSIVWFHRWYQTLGKSSKPAAGFHVLVAEVRAIWCEGDLAGLQGAPVWSARRRLSMVPPNQGMGRNWSPRRIIIHHQWVITQFDPYPLDLYVIPFWYRFGPWLANSILLRHNGRPKCGLVMNRAKFKNISDAACR